VYQNEEKHLQQLERKKILRRRSRSDLDEQSEVSEKTI
jgi:hypothetical protein